MSVIAFTSFKDSEADSSPILVLKDNITIRPYRLSDAPALSYHGNNRKIWLNLTDRFPHPYTEASAETWITICLDPASFFKAHDGRLLPSTYVICLDDQPIGSIGLERHSSHPHSVDLGYWLGEDHWGQGIMSLAAAAFLRWSFNTFSWITRIGGDAYGYNEASMHILQRIGMKSEGRRRLAVHKDDHDVDLVLFGIVRSEFLAEIYEEKARASDTSATRLSTSQI